MKNSLKATLLSTAIGTGVVLSTGVQASENIVSLKAVTVVATKTEQEVKGVPMQVSVVDADSPINGTVSKVSDLLKQVTGLEFSGGPRRNGEEIKLRGYNSEDIIITVDGKKQNFNSQHDGRFFLAPALIKRVDVVKGPSSALYGSGGLGGVVAFETKDAKDFLKDGETEGVQTTAGWQSANDEILFSATGYKRGDKFDAVASVTSSDSENIELGNGTELFSDDDTVSGLAKITYFIDDDSSIKFDYQGYFGNSIEVNNPQASPTFTTNINLVDKDNTVHQIGGEYKYNPNDHIDLTFRSYFVKTNVSEKYLEATSLNAVGDTLERQMKTFGFNLDNITKHYLGGNDHTFSYGIELVHDRQKGVDTSRTTRNGVPDADAIQFGAYFQDELKIDDIFDNGESELYIIPAVRFDSYRNSANSGALALDEDESLSPKIAANLKIDNNFNFFGSWAQAFRAPTLTELYVQGTHFPAGPFTNSFVANPNLKPETAETIEVGFGVDFDSAIQQNDDIAFKASRFWTKADDYIEQNVIAPATGTCNFPVPVCTTTFSNVSKAKLWGYEANLNYTSDLFNSSVGASYVAGKDNATGQHLNSISPLIVTVDVNRNWEQIDSVVGYYAKIAAPRDKYNLVSTEQTKQHDYVVHNLYVRYEPSELPNLSVDFAVDNILDKTYSETFANNYEVGRNFKVRLTYKW